MSRKDHPLFSSADQPAESRTNLFQCYALNLVLLRFYELFEQIIEQQLELMHYSHKYLNQQTRVNTIFISKSISGILYFQYFYIIKIFYKNHLQQGTGKATHQPIPTVFLILLLQKAFQLCILLDITMNFIKMHTTISIKILMLFWLSKV